MMLLAIVRFLMNYVDFVMMIEDIIIQIALDTARVLVAIILSAGALYSGMNMLDRITPDLDEWKEIKKGNLALGILFAAVMISLVLLIEPRIIDFVSNIRIDVAPITAAKLLIVTLFNYIIGLLSGIFVIYLTLHIIDRITPDLDEMKEMKKGNIAVALIYSVALILVILAVRVPFEAGFDMLIRNELLLLSFF